MKTIANLAIKFMISTLIHVDNLYTNFSKVVAYNENNIDSTSQREKPATKSSKMIQKFIKIILTHMLN